MKKTLSTILVLAFVMLVIVSCNKNNDKNNGNQPPVVPTEKTSLDVTLAASYSSRDITTYEQVNVDIQQVSFHTSGDSTVSSGWYDLETTPGIYNLMDYIVDDTLIAFDSLVSAQTISQIRLILGDSNTVMVDSVLYDLSTPSGQTSGIKLQVHTELLPDSAYVIMLDFDPEESVKETGSGKYKLKPVIRTIVNP